MTLTKFSILVYSNGTSKETQMLDFSSDSVMEKMEKNLLSLSRAKQGSLILFAVIKENPGHHPIFYLIDEGGNTRKIGTTIKDLRMNLRDNTASMFLREAINCWGTDKFKHLKS